jgi:GNAT superfamily N-acetyltransferase
MNVIARLRQARDEDVEELWHIDHMARGGDTERRHFISENVVAMNTVVAEDDSGLVGFAVYDRTFFGRGFVHLLYTADRVRRRGIGGQLLTFAADSCQTDKVFTSTNLTNHPMLALLTKLGWEPSGMLYGLDPGDPEVFFVRSKGAQ